MTHISNRRKFIAEFKTIIRGQICALQGILYCENYIYGENPCVLSMSLTFQYFVRHTIFIKIAVHTRNIKQKNIWNARFFIAPYHKKILNSINYLLLFGNLRWTSFFMWNHKCSLSFSSGYFQDIPALVWHSTSTNVCISLLFVRGLNPAGKKMAHHQERDPYRR